MSDNGLNSTNSFYLSSSVGNGLSGRQLVAGTGERAGPIFDRVVPGGQWSQYTVLRNGQPASTDTVIYPGDSVTIAQKNVKGN